MRRSCRRLAERAAGLAEEDVVQAGPVEGEGRQRDPRPVQEPDDLGGRGLAAVDVEAECPVLLGELADERLPLEDGAGRRGGTIGPHQDDVTGDLPLQLLGGALGDDLAVVDDGDAVAERVGLLEIVGGEEDGGAGFAQPADLVPHPGPALGVEPGGRLVEEEELGEVHQPDAHVEAALLAAGVGPGLAVAAVGELQGLEQLGGTRARIGGAHAVQAALHDQLPASGDLRVAAPLLADVADPLAHPAGLAEQVAAGNGRPAAGDREQGGEHPERRRLAGAVGAEEAEGLASLDVEVDAGDRLDGGRRPRKVRRSCRVWIIGGSLLVQWRGAAGGWGRARPSRCPPPPGQLMYVDGLEMGGRLSSSQVRRPERMSSREEVTHRSSASRSARSCSSSSRTTRAGASPGRGGGRLPAGGGLGPQLDDAVGEGVDGAIQGQ